MNDRILIDVKKFAAILDMSVSSVWRLARQGKLPTPIRIGHGTTRWKMQEVNDFLEKAERMES